MNIYLHLLLYYSAMKIINEKVSNDMPKEKLIELGIAICKKLNWKMYSDFLENFKRHEFHY